jgi:hypothetical protein
MTSTDVVWHDVSTGVVGSPTPHPAFGHLLPVEGRRDAVNAYRIFNTAFPRSQELGQSECTSASSVNYIAPNVATVA